MLTAASEMFISRYCYVESKCLFSVFIHVSATAIMFILFFSVKRDISSFRFKITLLAFLSIKLILLCDLRGPWESIVWV